MKINPRTGRVKARVRGVTSTVRHLAAFDQVLTQAAQQGCVDAAEHVRRKVQDKHGTYQPGWKKLSFAYKFKKLAKWGTTGNPLVASGALKKSWFVKKPTGKSIVASVTTNDPKAYYHITGAGVPIRDPLFPTVEEEADETARIIKRAVQDAANRVKKGG